MDFTSTQQEAHPFLTPTLLLSEPVSFTRKLKDTTFMVGQPLQLVCTYSGSPRVFVSWTKDGKPIWASYQYNVKTTDSSCILEILHSDRPTAAGTYACEISNGAGNDVCHARVSLGKVSNRLPSAFNAFINFVNNRSVCLLLISQSRNLISAFVTHLLLLTPPAPQNQLASSEPCETGLSA